MGKIDLIQQSKNSFSFAYRLGRMRRTVTKWVHNQRSGLCNSIPYGEDCVTWNICIDDLAEQGWRYDLDWVDVDYQETSILLGQLPQTEGLLLSMLEYHNRQTPDSVPQSMSDEMWLKGAISTVMEVCWHIADGWKLFKKIVELENSGQPRHLRRWRLRPLDPSQNRRKDANHADGTGAHSHSG